GPNGKQNFSDGIIDGKLVLDYSANNSHGNNVQKDGTVRKDLQPAVDAAVDVSDVIAHMPTTKYVGSITGSKTIYSEHHINVIKADKITLDGSATLTLKADHDDYYFINVTGKFAMTGTSHINLSGGIDTTHVIFNIIGSGEQVAFTGKSVGVGTFLAVHR